MRSYLILVILFISQCYIEKRKYREAVGWLDQANAVPIVGQDVSILYCFRLAIKVEDVICISGIKKLILLCHCTLFQGMKNTHDQQIHLRYIFIFFSGSRCAKRS